MTTAIQPELHYFTADIIWQRSALGFLAPGRGNEAALFCDFWECIDLFAYPLGLPMGIPLPRLLGTGSSFLAARANPPNPKPRCLPGPPL